MRKFVIIFVILLKAINAFALSTSDTDDTPLSLPYTWIVLSCFWILLVLVLLWWWRHTKKLIKKAEKKEQNN